MSIILTVTDKLQRVMNAAVRVVSGTKKYDRGLTHLLHSELHWLDVADRVTYKLGVTVYKCLHGQAPDYLSELCTLVAQVAERQHLRSTSRHLLVVPRFQLHTYGRRTFAVAGATTWNLFQNNLREPDMQIDCFRRTLKTFFWSVLGTLSALEAFFCDDALYKLTFTFTSHTPGCIPCVVSTVISLTQQFISSIDLMIQ